MYCPRAVRRVVVVIAFSYLLRSVISVIPGELPLSIAISCLAPSDRLTLLSQTKLIAVTVSGIVRASGSVFPFCQRQTQNPIIPYRLRALSSRPPAVGSEPATKVTTTKGTLPSAIGLTPRVLQRLYWRLLPSVWFFRYGLTFPVSTNGCSLSAIRADDRPSITGVSFGRQRLMTCGTSRAFEEGAHSPARGQTG
eukprot:422971-Pyramimonas_sp.AAC.3